MTEVIEAYLAVDHTRRQFAYEHSGITTSQSHTAFEVVCLDVNAAVVLVRCSQERRRKRLDICPL